MRLSNDKSPGAIASGTLTAGRFFPQQGRRFRASDKLILDQAGVSGHGELSRGGGYPGWGSPSHFVGRSVSL